MKIFKILLLLISLGFSVSAQILNPVSWTFSSEKLNESEANLIITATIDDKWHIYSMFVEEGGPVPTTLSFKKNADYTLIGKPSEAPKAISAFDKNFGITIAWHDKKAVFKQKIKLNKANATVNGSVEFMVCNDKQCLPPDELEFTIKLVGYNPSKKEIENVVKTVVKKEEKKETKTKTKTSKK